MKTTLLLAALMSVLVSEANAAVVCAAGVYRAGCVVARPYGVHPYVGVGVHPYVGVGLHPYARPYRRY
jgi:hypothetical protein